MLTAITVAQSVHDGMTWLQLWRPTGTSA